MIFAPAEHGAYTWYMRGILSTTSLISFLNIILWILLHASGDSNI